MDEKHTRILYSYFRSSAAYRVRIALHLKGLTYETRDVHLTKNGGENWLPEYLSVNPQGFVPTFVDNGNVIIQSLAIIEYLDEAYTSSPLLPDTAINRASCRALSHIISCDVHPLNNLRVMSYLTDKLSCSQEFMAQWYCKWINEGLKAFEIQLRKRKTDTPYCCGNQPSMADICLIPQLYNARRFHCDLSPYPVITEIEHTCNEHNAFMAAAPERQPDTPPDE